MKFCLRNCFCLLLLELGMVTAAHARHLTGYVVDSKSGERLAGVVVELLSVSDSSRIRSVVTGEKQIWGTTTIGYDIDVDNNTSYILRFTMVGYKAQCKNVKVEMAERVNEQWVEEIKLEEDARLLDEVVVKATKIKMVMRGDTVVYDASAFNVSEGSMLDALIRQMPGTTLENGVIKVNGRTVNSLLVDGRDFFKGDAKTALQNLPAYTVDKVKVYDKRGQNSRLMGRDMNDREYVLDVGLKKQYQHGMLGNVQLSGGTDHRYGSNLFAMGYGKHSRLTIVGSMNNVNDQRVPGEEGGMAEMGGASNGLTAKKQLGLSYRHEGSSEDHFQETENTFTYNDNDILTRTTSQTFLTGGDYYGLGRNANRSRVTSWATNNSIGFTPRHHIIGVGMGASYTDTQGRGNSLTGRFNAHPDDMSQLDSLFMPDAGRRLLAMSINRVRNDNRNNGSTVNYHVDVSDRIAFGKPDDWNNLMSVYAYFQYDRNNVYRHALNLLDYLGSAPSADHRNEYSTDLDHSYSLTTRLDYTRIINLDSAHINTIFLRPSYSFKKTYNASDNNLYRLDQLADYTDEHYALGVLPSTREALLSVLDGNNSYFSREHEMQQGGSVMLSLIHGDGVRMPRFSAELNLPLEVRHGKLETVREKTYARSRTSLYFEPNINLDYHFNDSTGTRFVRLSYQTSQQEPSLGSLLDMRFDANPLIITEGNPDLRKARTHSLNLMATMFNMHTQAHLGANLNFNTVKGAIATATRYDKQTGVTTTQQTNVDGNWSLSGSVSGNWPIDRKKRLSLLGNLHGSYANSVDLTTVAGEDYVRSEVHNVTGSANLGLEYQLGSRLRLFFQSGVVNQRANSDRTGFTTVNAWQFRNVFEGSVELPWGMEVSTTLSDFLRSGYNDEQMNTNDLLWNMRVSKKLLHNRLTFALDGFDILGSLSNTAFTLDAQGRTETWTNTVSRYFMLNVAYKFTVGMQRP